MASFTYNAGSKALQDGTVDWASDTIKIMLVTDAHTPDQDHDHIDDIAGDEVSVSGYAGGFSGAGRKTLGSKTQTNDTTNDRTVYDAADPSAWTLAAGETVQAAVVYWHDTDDATSIPLFYLEFATPIATNGGSLTVPFDAAGIAYTQQ